MSDTLEKQLAYMRADYKDAQERVARMADEATSKLRGAFTPGAGGRQGWLWVFLRRVRAVAAVWRMWSAYSVADRQRQEFNDLALQHPNARVEPK